MAFYFVISTQENSFLLSNRPSADSIWNVLQAVQLPQATRWVSPLARITRYNQTGFRGWATDVTWVFEVQGPYSPDAARGAADQVASGVNAALTPLSSDWSPATVDVYTEAKYGPLAAWLSGQAATPQFDHSAIVQAENAALRAEQAGVDAVELAQRAAAATGQYVEQAGGRLGSIFGTTIASVLKPIPATTILLVGLLVAGGAFAAVKIWRAV